MGDKRLKSSQDIIDDFWKTSITTTEPPTKRKHQPTLELELRTHRTNYLCHAAFSILPKNVYAKRIRDKVPEKGLVGGRSVAASYEAAVNECVAKVQAIVQECKRNNQKYSDPHFNLDDVD